MQPRPSPQVDQIAKWKAQAIEKERVLAEQRRARSMAQSSALPALGGNDAPDRVASRVASMPTHLSYSAQSSAPAMGPTRRSNAASREQQRRERAVDDRYISTRARGSDLAAAVEARQRVRRQTSTTASSYGVQAPAPAPAPESQSNNRDPGSRYQSSSVATASSRHTYEHGRRVAVSPAPSPALSATPPTHVAVSPALSPAPSATPPTHGSSKSAAPVPGRQAVAGPAPTDSKGKKLCCDACDGPHLTAECPLYKGKAREKHKDGQKGKPKEIGSGTGGNFVLSKAKEVRMPPDGSCLFHSLCYGLGMSSAPSLRKEIANFIAKNPDLEIAGDPLKDWIAWDGGGSVSSYTRKMASPNGPWGGGIEMAACSRYVLAHLASAAVVGSAIMTPPLLSVWILTHVAVADCTAAMFTCTRSSGCVLVSREYRALTATGQRRQSTSSTVAAFTTMRFRPNS